MPIPAESVNMFDDDASTLLRMLGHSPVNLVALHPDNAAPPVAVTGTRTMAAAFVETHAMRNVYFSANQVRADMGNDKPKKSDVARLTTVWLDLDPEPNANFAQERERLRRIVDTLTDDEFLAPSAVIDSGGGYQALWLVEPLPATPENVAALEAQNRGLAMRFGGDAVHNADRLLRLPGTTNFPSAKKRAAGRSVAPAKIIFHSDSKYALTTLAHIAAPINKTESESSVFDGPLQWPPAAPDADLSRRVLRLAAADATLSKRYTGDADGLRDPSRSGLDFALAFALKRNGLDAQDAAAVMYDWPHGRGAEMDERYFRRAWGRNSATTAKDEFDEVEIEPEAPRDPLDDEIDALTDSTNSDAADLDYICPTKFQGVAIPERRWLVPDFVPMGYTTSLYGDGGVGKTLLAQQLATAVGAGTDWIGMKAVQGKVLALFCEDAPDELQRRQHDINRAHGISFIDIGNVRWLSRVGKDNVLTVFDKYGTLSLTKFGKRFLKSFVTFQPVLTIIDTAADTFGGNENSRSDARRYLSLLNGMAQKADEWGGGAVLLCAHPSRDGMSSGRGDGGNTAWNNGVRSRLYLSRPTSEDGEADPNARLLQRKKANYAAADADVPLRWDHGVLLPDSVDFPDDAVRDDPDLRRVALDQGVLKSIDKMLERRVKLSLSKQSSAYAPRKLRELPEMKRWREAEILTSLQRLFDAQTLIIAPALRDAQRRAQDTIVRR